MFTTSTPVIAENGATSLASHSAPNSHPSQANSLEWHSPIAATATAVSALVLSEQHTTVLNDANLPDEFDAAYQGDLCELIVGSAHWLAQQQRQDGGFLSFTQQLPSSAASDLPTTVLIRSAFQLTGVPAAYEELMGSMNQFIEISGGLAELRNGESNGNSASLIVQGIVGLTEALDCHHMPSIPLETACFEESSKQDDFWAGRGEMLPAIVALGLASYHACKPMNPFTAWRRGRAFHRALDWLGKQQQPNGGFCGSVASTSVVIMSLASIAQASSPIVRNGVEFLFANLTGEGYWDGTAVTD